MAAKFGTLVERLVGAEVFFAPDGETIGAASAAISKLVKPATPASAYPDYNLGRVTMVKYDPKTKDRVREWASSSGGYKERTDKVVLSDQFQFTSIDYAPQLYDQLMFGTANLADPTVSSGVQQAFQKSNRYKDGWLYMFRYNEAGTKITTLEIHVRISIDTPPEDKNEPGSPVWRVVHLADAGALDVVTFVAG